MAGKAANSVLLTSKNLTKHMTASLEKNLAHAILDRRKEGDYVPQRIILMALKVTGDVIETDQITDESSISSRSALDRHGLGASDLHELDATR